MKSLIVTQEIIRVVNYHQNLKGRVKLKLRAKLLPKIASILRERIKEVLDDPDEDVFFSSKHKQHNDQDSDADEQQLQKAMASAAEKQGWYVGKIWKKRKDVRKKRR